MKQDINKKTIDFIIFSQTKLENLTIQAQNERIITNYLTISMLLPIVLPVFFGNLLQSFGFSGFTSFFGNLF